MSFIALSSAIHARWQANWTYTATAYDNRPFTDTPGASWARISVRDGDARQVTIGPATMDRHAGVVMIQIFTPLFRGSEQNRWLADKAAQIFRKVSVPITNYGQVTFSVPYMVASEQSGDNWWQVTVVCPYAFDVWE